LFSSHVFTFVNKGDLSLLRWKVVFICTLFPYNAVKVVFNVQFQCTYW
jgi:hypothetical protein